MRKVTSLLLTIAFVLSTLAFAAIGTAAESAPAVGTVASDYTPDANATAINTAEDFAAMAADGNYYLAADISITAAYTKKFTGTFDGNGKTITTAVPLFKDMSGTFKNATIEGTAAGSVDIDKKGYSGSVTAYPTGTVVIDNVCNNAAVTAPSTCGGILGYGKDKCSVTITNCVNNGSVTSKGGQTGGIVGYVPGTTLTVKNCVNNGAIDAGTSYGAGIVGRFGKDASTAEYKLVIEDCLNTGSVTSGKDQSAGVLAYLVGIGYIKNSVNKGDINNVAASGGILGQSASNSGNKISGIEIEGCINFGKISGEKNVGGIAASFGRLPSAAGYKYEMKNCINFGEVVSKVNVKLYNSDLTSDAPKNTPSSYCAGGVVGYAYGGPGTNGIFNCANFGKVSVSTGIAAEDFDKQVDILYVAGILGYVNTSTYNFKNNYNAGEVTATNVKNLKKAESFININEAGSDSSYVSGNKTLAVEGSVNEINGTQDSFVTTFTKDELASGSVAYAVNQAIGKEVLFQTIGTDAIPVTVPVVKVDSDGQSVVANSVVAGDDGTFANPEISGIEVPDVPSLDPVSPATGDATGVMFVLLAVSALACFGLALVPSKKHN